MSVPRLAVLLAAATLTCAAGDKSDEAKPKTHVRLGGISVGFGYSRYAGPFAYPWYPGLYPSYYAYWWGPYWSPFWDLYAPLYYPGFFPGYLAEAGPGAGEVRLNAPATAEVYLNGGFAGVAGDLKTMWLKPGAYDLEVRSMTGTYERRIYVLSGKKLKIDATGGEAKR